MKKIWNKPAIDDLSVKFTLEVCNYDITLLGLGNEEYTDPNNKPAQHPHWVWCTEHGRWHPKNHGFVTAS